MLGGGSPAAGQRSVNALPAGDATIGDSFLPTQRGPSTSHHTVSSRYAECRVSFSFNHFHFKLLSLMRYNLFMGVDEMRVKILPLLCRLGLVLRLGSV